jgi:GrpB-like predicted nucleotidyltransferase (UPF0157 family)
VDSIELIGGPEKRDIRVVAHNSHWPERFELERRRIVVALGAPALRVDHVGSTSVPGLAAKPIVDIDVSVPDVYDEAAYLGPLVAAGYGSGNVVTGWSARRDAMCTYISAPWVATGSADICCSGTGCAGTSTTGASTSDSSWSSRAGTGPT